jgi:rhamnose utilization protein RhaD (predicted bifunctional aldolase and dehydrogenase)
MTDLRLMSSRIGRDPTLVQGSGGNTSIKDGNVLWVKASGTWLAEAAEQDIMVPIGLRAAQQMTETGNDGFINARLHGTLRPSIETSLHCQLNHKIVAHVHSVNAIATNVQEGAKKRLLKQLKGINWRYIPYAKPGLSLTAEVIRVLAEEPGNPSLLVLENHGLVLGGETCATVEALLSSVESKLQITERATGNPNISQLETAIEHLDGWRLPAFPYIHGIALDTNAIKVATGGVLIPDHAVFLEKNVPVCESPGNVKSTLEQYKATFGEQPDWMIIRDIGVILSEKIGAVGEDQLRGLAMIGLRIPYGAAIKYIDEHAAEDLRAWEAEKYRKRIGHMSPSQRNKL